MIFWLLAVGFFTVTFVPRLYTMANLGYGFLNLGLYTQLLHFFKALNFNPFIPSWGRTFFAVRPQPAFLFLVPVSQLTTEPWVILFIDEAAVILAAWVCARFAWAKTQSEPMSWAVFTVMLFSPVTFEALQNPGNMALWASVPLVLLFAEYFQLRRPGWLFAWFLVLCLLDPHFGVIAALVVPLLLFTHAGRWNWNRRIRSALPLAVVAAFAISFLYLVGHKPQFDRELFVQTYSGMLTTWGLNWLFLLILCPEIIIVCVALLSLRLGGGPHDPALILGLGALGALQGFHLLKVNEKYMKSLVAWALVAVVCYGQFTSRDPMFHFWVQTRRSIMPRARQLRDVLGKIPVSASVAASDAFTVPLADHATMMTLYGLKFVAEAPDYVVTAAEPSPFDHDPSYKVIDSLPQSGARLLKRIK